MGLPCLIFISAGYAHSTDAEFFDMLRAYKADNADQRAPAPPGIQKVLRGESEASSNTKHSSPVKQATVQPILPHHATPYNPHQSQPAGGNTPHQPQPAGNIPPGQFYQQQPIHSTPNTQYQQPQIQQSVKPAPPPQTHQPHQQVSNQVRVCWTGTDLGCMIYVIYPVLRSTTV